MSQFSFVSWYTDVMTSLLEWGSSCPCHSSSDPKKDRDACPHKGRLLSRAFQYGTQHMHDAMVEVNSWDVSKTCGDVSVLRQAQACMRSTWLLAQEKLRFLDELPYLLCRLHEDGVRDRCVAQFSECTEDHHDPVSVEFLGEASLLRPQILAMNSDGSGMGPDLHQAWTSLNIISIDDTPGESPHASMRHTQLKARAATWPWHSSTNRLKQNLRDCESLLPQVSPKTDLQWAWDQRWSVAQMRSGRAQLRPVRAARAKMERRIYTMEQFDNFRLDDVADNIGDEDDDDDDDDNAGDDADDDNDSPEQNTKVDSFGQMLCDYYQQAFGSFKRGSFFSVLGSDDDGGQSHRVFQLLSYRVKLSLVKTHRVVAKPVCKMGISWLETWAVRGEGENMQLDVFGVDEPINVDLAAWVKSVDDRANIYSWTEIPCDVFGCISIETPKILEATAKMNDKKVPVLALVDALTAEGFSFVDALVHHKPHSILKIVDGRKLWPKRHYYQCVLARQTLWDRGVVGLKSNRAASWYWLLLHNKADGLTKENMKRRLSELDGKVDVGSLDRPAKYQRQNRPEDGIVGDDPEAEVEAPIVGEPEAEVESPIVGEPEAEVEAPIVGMLVEVEAPIVGMPAEVEAPMVGEPAEEAPIAGEDVEDPFEIPDFIEGCRVSTEAHDNRGDVGLRVVCKAHAACRKYYSMHKDPFTLGPRFAEFFFGSMAAP